MRYLRLRRGHGQGGTPTRLTAAPYVTYASQGAGLKGGCGPFYTATSRAPRSPPARARILSHATSFACAASFAHSPWQSSHVEAVGQDRGQDAAHLRCQPPRHVVAPLSLAPSLLQLPARHPAPFEEFAVGAMPSMRAVERSRAEPTAVLICMFQAWWKPSPRPACELS